MLSLSAMALGSPGSDRMPHVMTLLEEFELRPNEQLALAAAYLRLMNADLEAHPDTDRQSVRDEYREQLRSGPLGSAVQAPALLPIESTEPFEDLAVDAVDTARSLAAL